MPRDGFRGVGGLIQRGTNLLGGDVLQHTKHGMPPGRFLKIDAKILQLRDNST